MFFHLQSATMSPCSLTKDAYAYAQSTWLCTGCCSPKQDIGAVDVELEESPPKNAPLNFVNGCGVPIALRAFISEIEEVTVRRELLIGRVYDENSKLLDDWVTFRGRHRLIIRGSKNASYRVCDQCGRHVYFAMGKRYLFPEPPKDIEIFESDLFGFVLSERLFSGIDLTKWRNFSVDKLTVPKTPMDSLGELR